ncbi:tRNA (guanine(37)-N(1))-methyltransferase [Candidatus Roizmanbacteria bacterium]|nr:tRNA (guanine(37)-N(1))-methyltransferase [Candidatus Roizmanbacteria bacterium]
MKITILTLFPKMIKSFFEESIVKRAQERKLVEIKIINIRDYAVDNYGTVDDRPYGGGVGMVMRVDVIYKAIESVILSKAKDLSRMRGTANKLRDSSVVSLPQNDKKRKVILTSPKGKLFTQQKAQEYSKLDRLIIIAGHYEGVDERVRDFVDEEISLGDFVMTGGEIAASAIVDSVVRLLSGVLKNKEATQSESFFTVTINQLIVTIGENATLRKLKEKEAKKVKLLEYPQYTRPEEFMGKKVPEILLSGDHKKIEKWRLKKAFEETLRRRPDLLK